MADFGVLVRTFETPRRTRRQLTLAENASRGRAQFPDFERGVPARATGDVLHHFFTARELRLVVIWIRRFGDDPVNLLHDHTREENGRSLGATGIVIKFFA